MIKSIQLYSVRSVSKDNLKLALQKVSEIGYEGVEFAGFYDNSAQDVKSWLTEFNLVPTGSHVKSDMMFEKPQEVIEYHKIIGCDIIICPFWETECRADVEALADKLNSVAPLYNAAGMQVAYHNHVNEYKVEDGKTYMDLLAELTDPNKIKFELDVYWVFCGGYDPLSEMEKFRDRLIRFHAKDGDKDKGLTIGTGGVDMVGVINKAKELCIPCAVAESEATEVPEQQLTAVAEDFAALCNLL